MQIVVSPMNKRPQLRQRTTQKMKHRYVAAVAFAFVLVAGSITIFLNLGSSDDARAAVTYTWTGTADSLWSNSLNWNPNGVPSGPDIVTVPAGCARYPVLTAETELGNLTMATGTQLNLNSYNLNLSGQFIASGTAALSLGSATLSIAGVATFNAGTVTGSTGSKLLVTGSYTTFGSGTGGPVISTSVDVNSARITVRNTVFNGSTALVKTGTANDQCVGNNTFNGTTTLTNAGTGYFLFGNSTRDIFNGQLSLNCTNTGILYIAHNGTNTQFNEDIEVNSSGSGGIRIGGSTGTSTLASGKYIRQGTGGLTLGTFLLARITFAGSEAQSLSASGSAVITLGPAAVMNGNLTVNSPGVVLSGITCMANTEFTKTGSSNDQGAGNNVFNGPVIITNTGSGYITAANATRDIFNATLKVVSAGSGSVYMSHCAASTQFNDHVTVASSVGAGGVRFGASGGSAAFAPGKELLIDATGFNGGLLLLGGLGFSDVMNRSFVLGNSATLQFGSSSVFTGEVAATAGGFLLSGSVFNRKLTLTKTGISNDYGNGNNTFHDSVIVTNNGSGFLLLANATRDVFNSYCSFTTSGGLIYVAYRGTDNLFNGDVEVNSTGNGVRFSTSTGNSILAAGASIRAGASGFSAGQLMIGRVSFSGTSEQSFVTSGTSSVVLGPGLVANGRMQISAPGINFNGGTYNDVVDASKTGSSNDGGGGNNTFNDSLILRQNGTGYIVLSNNTRDVYNGKVCVYSSASGIVYLAYEGTLTEFNDDVILSSTGNGNIRIGAGGGTSTLASGKQLLTGADGFVNGYLTLSRLTFSGSTSRSISMSSGAYVNLGPSVVVEGPLVVNAGGVKLNGGQYSAPLTVTKTGAMNDDGSGNNVFDDRVELTNAGTGYLMTSNSTFDTFNDDAVFTSTSSGLVYVAQNDTATLFNGDVRVNSTSTGGVRFGGGNGLCRLAAGHTISVGSTGFTSGGLFLRRVIQLGDDSINLNAATGTALLTLSTGCSFSGSLNVNFPQVLLNGITCERDAVVEKNGASTNSSAGGNVFNGRVTFVNSGSGTFQLAGTSGDDYNDDVVFRQTGSGPLQPASIASCTFAGSITVEGTASSMIFSNGSTADVVFDGAGEQSFNINGSTTTTFRRMTMNNTSGLRLNAPLNISHKLVLNAGVVYTSGNNLIIIGSAVSSVQNASSSSYVDGPLRRTGNAAFSYPVGKNGKLRPVTVDGSSSASDQFTAEYFDLNPDVQWKTNNKISTLHSVSKCEYWTLTRNAGSANVRVGLSWLSPVSCGISNISDLRVARWDSVASRWSDLGNGSVTGDVSAGTLLSLSAASPYGVFTLGSSSAANSLPVELMFFNAEMEDGKVACRWRTQSEKNNSHFTIERSRDGLSYEVLGDVTGSGTSQLPRDYVFDDVHPLAGLSYYRLRQTDFNGQFETFRPVSVEWNAVSKELVIQKASPNPFSSFIRLQVLAPASGVVQVALLNNSGVVVYSDEMSVNEGITMLDFNIESSIASGLYFIRVSNDNATAQLVKLMKE